MIAMGERERVWEETVVAHFKALYQHSHIGTAENTEFSVRTVGVPGEIRNEHVPNKTA
jgi:hypothetical protein